MNLRDFSRRKTGGLVLYTCRRLDELPRLCHGFSTRLDEGSPAPFNLSSTQWDLDTRVAENRARFLAALGLARDSLALVSQVHSDKVHIICRGSESWNPLTQGDALATGEAGVALGVRTADCLPILVADSATGAVGAVHAGWRGILARIGRKAVEAMCRELGADPGRMLVAVGPGIGPCCLEVGPDVIRPFEKHYPAEIVLREHPVDQAKRLLDLRAGLGIQLSEAGVRPENVFDLDACTRCRKDEFFSYRAEGPLSGRLLAVIARRGDSGD